MTTIINQKQKTKLLHKRRIINHILEKIQKRLDAKNNTVTIKIFMTKLRESEHHIITHEWTTHTYIGTNETSIKSILS